MAECPFSWTEQEKGCVFTRKVWAPVECRREACQLWTGSDCVFNEIARSLKSMETAIQRKEQ